MSSRDRIGWGHALTGVGLLVRRLATPLALLAPAVLLLTAMTPQRSSLDPVWLVVLPVAAFLAARAIAVGVAAIGWAVFPPEHRGMLAELASRPGADG